MGLADAIKTSMHHGGTMLGAAIDRINTWSPTTA